MKREVDIEIRAHDSTNPKIGYWLRIRDSFTGEILLHTEKDPINGKPLKTSADCLAVAMMYAEPKLPASR